MWCCPRVVAALVLLVFVVGTSASIVPARYGMGVASDANLVIFAGGYDGITFYGAINSFTVGGRTASPSGNLTGGARAFIAAAAFNGIFMFAGGEAPDRFASSAVDIYNSSSQSWLNVPMTTARSNAALAATGNVFVISGGWVDAVSRLPTDSVEIFSVSTRTWSTSPYKIHARLNLVAVAVGSYLLFVGGENTTSVCGNVDMYDSGMNRWSTYELPAPRTRIAATSASGYAVFAGGYPIWNNQTPSDVIDVYDVTTNAWDHSRRLGEARGDAVAVAAGNYAYIIGGKGQNEPLSTERLELSTGIVSNTMFHEADAFQLGGGLAGDTIIVGGGLTRTSDAVESTFNFTQTSAVCPLPAPAEGLVCRDGSWLMLFITYTTEMTVHATGSQMVVHDRLQFMPGSTLNIVLDTLQQPAAYLINASTVIIADDTVVNIIIPSYTNFDPSATYECPVIDAGELIGDLSHINVIDQTGHTCRRANARQTQTSNLQVIITVDFRDSCRGSGLSRAAIAGIIVGSVAAVAIVVVVIAYVAKKKFWARELFESGRKQRHATYVK